MRSVEDGWGKVEDRLRRLQDGRACVEEGGGRLRMIGGVWRVGGGRIKGGGRVDAGGRWWEMFGGGWWKVEDRLRSAKNWLPNEARFSIG